MKFWAFQYKGHGDPDYFLVADTEEEARELIKQCIEANSNIDDIDWGEPWLTSRNLLSFEEKDKYKVFEVRKGMVVVSHND
jgi:hypothetical protein